MRALFTGQTGIDKKSQLQALRDFCARKGKSIEAVFNVGDIMYEESRKSGATLKEGKILDLPLAQLGALRRGAFNLIRSHSSGMSNVFVNSHAVFRWNNRLMRAFELPEVKEFQPDVIVTLIDDVEAVKMRLDAFKSSGDLPPDTKYSLKDLLVWREEEMLASEILASVLDIPHYVLGISLEEEVSPGTPGGDVPSDVRALEEEDLRQLPYKRRASQAGHLGKGGQVSQALARLPHRL